MLVQKCVIIPVLQIRFASPNGSGYNTSYCQYIKAAIIPIPAFLVVPAFSFIPAFPSFQLSGVLAFLSFYVSSRRSGHRKIKEQKGDAYRTVSPRIALKGDHLLILAVQGGDENMFIFKKYACSKGK